MSNLRTDYISKLCTAERAVREVKSGDTVYIGSTSSIAYALCRALEARSGELHDVTVTCSQFRRPSKMFTGTDGRFSFKSYFMGTEERNGLRMGNGDFTSVHLSQIEIWCRETARPDVAFIEVSPCDEDGYMSFGATGVALHQCICSVAKTVILQVNSSVPYVYGEKNLIHCSQADYIVEADDRLETVEEIAADETVKTMSRNIVELIPDGATIQLGLGGLASAVGYGLQSKNDLGVHTEMMGDVIMHLMKNGNVTNHAKSYMPGVSVTGFAYGTNELYHFLDRNRSIYFMPFSKVNDPAVIAKNDRMVSINTAMSIDLFGQVAADSMGFKQHSGTGGQLDFVRGAQNSKDGKSFFAITSTMQHRTEGRKSRIVLSFPPGTAITTPRSDVQYVATEYGCVNLKPLSMKDRVRAMISLAHPDFRDELTEQAKEHGII